MAKTYMKTTGTTKTGTLAINSASKTVTGTSTLFTTEVVVGDLLYGVDAGKVIGRVATIASNTSLTLVDLPQIATDASTTYKLIKESTEFTGDDGVIYNIRPSIGWYAATDREQAVAEVPLPAKAAALAATPVWSEVTAPTYATPSTANQAAAWMKLTGTTGSGNISGLSQGIREGTPGAFDNIAVGDFVIYKTNDGIDDYYCCSEVLTNAAGDIGFVDEIPHPGSVASTPWRWIDVSALGYDFTMPFPISGADSADGKEYLLPMPASDKLLVPGPAVLFADAHNWESTSAPTPASPPAIYTEPALMTAVIVTIDVTGVDGVSYHLDATNNNPLLVPAPAIVPALAAGWTLA